MCDRPDRRNLGRRLEAVSAWRFRLELRGACGNNPTHPTTARGIVVRLDLLIVM